MIRYLAGFIDPANNEFFPNILTDHKGNAEGIISSKNWNDIWKNDYMTKREAPDFLIFRKGFIQIGNSNQKVIVISKDFYAYDLEYSKVWRAIRKSLTDSQFDCVRRYKIIPIMSPRF